MMYMATMPRRDPAIDMFLDQREEERLLEEGRLAFGEDDGWMDCWAAYTPARRWWMKWTG